MSKPKYPTGSEYCIRLTGNVYHYVNKIQEDYKLAVRGSDTRRKANMSLKANEFRRVIEKVHPEFFEFTKSVGCNRWVIKKLQGNLFLIAYSK